MDFSLVFQLDEGEAWCDLRGSRRRVRNRGSRRCDAAASDQYQREGCFPRSGSGPLRCGNSGGADVRDRTRILSLRSVRAYQESAADLLLTPVRVGLGRPSPTALNGLRVVGEMSARPTGVSSSGDGHWRR